MRITIWIVNMIVIKYLLCMEHREFKIKFEQPMERIWRSANKIASILWSFSLLRGKAGASYQINQYFSLLAGFGWYDTYAEGGNFKRPMVKNEFRTWLQLSMKQNLSCIKFEHRYHSGIFPFHASALREVSTFCDKMELGKASVE